MAELVLPNATFRVVALPRFAQGGRWRTEAMRSYGQPVLIWFTKGQGRITVAGNTRGYGAHNAIFLPPGIMHGFDMLGSVFGWVVFFPADFAADLPAEPQHIRFRESQQHGELTGLVENLLRESERALPDQDRMLRHHGGILSVWLDRQVRARAGDMPEPDAARRLTAAFTALVERDFHTARTVSDYARALGVTPTHLSRVCNIACGHPASGILTDRKHFEARRLLRETRKPVKQIAAELGFASAAYFTRAFHHNTGQTPSAFRRAR